jgi:hypothetical protein
VVIFLNEKSSCPFNTPVKIKRARYFFPFRDIAESFGDSPMDIIGRHRHVNILGVRREKSVTIPLSWQ